MAKDFIELRGKLKDFGIKLYGKTPILGPNQTRGEEIKTYLDYNKNNIKSYVVIDDMNGRRLRPCSSHLLQTSEYKGLEEKHIKIIEKILNNMEE